MKSFSSTSFATDQTEVLARAQAAVNQHPQALFTDFQWFLYEGKDTVFYNAFSSKSYTKDDVENLVAEMVGLAPQLTHGFVGARVGEPFPNHMLEAITSVETVDSFEGYPDKWLSTSADILARDDLPLFRVMIINRRGGPDTEGRASMIQVRASHAVMEGSDSALLTRSASAGHGIMSDKTNKVSLWSRIRGAIGAWSMTAGFLFVATALAPAERPNGFKTLAISRHRLRVLARRLGVRTRSLMFALVVFALNGEGDKKLFSRRMITAAYTMLDGNRTAADDDFFRVRALMAKFRWNEDFLTFVRNVDDSVGTIESQDITKFQVMMLAMFKTLRTLNRVFAGFPGARFWRFQGRAVSLVLTLVPPHRTYGGLTEGVLEPIYCGAWHSGVNICTFCPGRKYVTFNFTAETRIIDSVHKIEELLDRVEALDVPASLHRLAARETEEV